MAINFLAVLISAVVAMALGAIWYMPRVLGEKWMKYMRLSPMDLDKAKEKGMAKSYVFNFLTWIVLSFVLAQFLIFFNATGVVDGMVVAFWSWLGFVATLSLGDVLWDPRRSFPLWVVNNIYNLVTFLVIGAILGSSI